MYDPAGDSTTRDDRIRRLVTELRSRRHELEWVEFKANLALPHVIGQYLSALSNAAALHGETFGYLVWGIEDGTAEVIGTSFQPYEAKGKGAEPLIPWLTRLLRPALDFRFEEVRIDGRRIVVLIVPAAPGIPVRFEGEEHIRIGSSNRKLRDHPEKERALWHRFTRVAFESGVALDDVSAADTLLLLAAGPYFEMMKLPDPTSPDAIMRRLVEDDLVTASKGRFAITNLGAITYGRSLRRLRLDRKAIRVIVYEGSDRLRTIREAEFSSGYAVGFEETLRFINAQLPANELIDQALRRDVPMYPELAVRELVANAVIHQDFSMGGTGPLVEIFKDRVEITNPGTPLVDPQRFLDAPPRSRNERLAALMRRVGICEERGSGIDKVITEAELYQLPAPEFRAQENHTVVRLFAPRPWRLMTKEDRIRACYQHAALRWLAREPMTNTTLRTRFGLSDNNAASASRVITDTVEAALVRPYEPENRSRKHARYVPFWA